MKTVSKKLFTLLLAVVMIAGFAVPAFAATTTMLISPAPYTGEEVNFVKSDGSGFGMFAPQEGTTAAIDGDKVVIHYEPKNKTVYNGIHWGLITDAELTKDVAFNEDGSFDLSLSADKCGTLTPIAPIKASDGTTSASQYYLAIPAADKLDKAVTQPATIAFSGEDVNFVKADGSGFGMFAPQEGTTIALEGDNVVIHYVPKNTTVYNGIHWGPITDAALTKDVVFNADGSFDISLSKDKCGTMLPVAPVKAKDGATSADQYYLAVPAADKIKPAVKGEALTIVNNTGMFKADSASLAEGKLTVVLTGTTYENLFKGTYNDAVANGNNRANWIKGAPNAEGKMQFEIPVAADESVIDIISISNTYLAKFDAGEGELSRAFYPRQFKLDREAKTLTVGDYEGTNALTVTNNVKMFKVDGAELLTQGGPNSNNYELKLVLKMGSTSFDKAFVGRADAAAASDAETAALTDQSFTLRISYMAERGKPESIVNPLGEQFILSFHSVNKDAWYERAFTIDSATNTLVIDEAPVAATFTDVPATSPYFEAVEWAVKNGITDGVSKTLFDPNGSCTRAQVVTFLWRAAGKPSSSGVNPFADVKEGDYFYEAVLWAFENGITDGVSATKFDPDGNCTRAHVVTFLWRAAGKTAPTGSNAFADLQDGDYYYEAALWAVEKGLISATAETAFSPDGLCTRGQAVTSLFLNSKA